MNFAGAINVAYTQEEGRFFHKRWYFMGQPFSRLMLLTIKGMNKKEFDDKYHYQINAFQLTRNAKPNKFPLERVKMITDIVVSPAKTAFGSDANTNLRLLWGDNFNNVLCNIPSGNVHRAYRDRLKAELELQILNNKLHQLLSSTLIQDLEERIAELKEKITTFEGRKPMEQLVASVPTSLFQAGILNFAYPELKGQEDKFEMVYDYELGFFKPNLI